MKKKFTTAYFCGYSKMPSNVTASEVYGSLTLGLKVNLQTEVIEETSVTLLSELAKSMINEYFVGKKINQDYDEIIAEINARHQGGVRKALIKAYSDIRRNFVEYMATY
jgi:hypothetical protein